MTIESILQTVGTTRLVRLDRMGQGLFARITTKLEMRIPCGSVEDCVGGAMIADAERRGVLAYDVGSHAAIVPSPFSHSSAGRVRFVLPFGHRWMARVR